MHYHVVSTVGGEPYFATFETEEEVAIQSYMDIVSALFIKHINQEGLDEIRASLDAMPEPNFGLDTDTLGLVFMTCDDDCHFKVLN